MSHLLHGRRALLEAALACRRRRGWWLGGRHLAGAAWLRGLTNSWDCRGAATPQLGRSQGGGRHCPRLVSAAAACWRAPAATFRARCSCRLLLVCRAAAAGPAAGVLLLRHSDVLAAALAAAAAWTAAGVAGTLDWVCCQQHQQRRLRCCLGALRCCLGALIYRAWRPLLLPPGSTLLLLLLQHQQAPCRWQGTRVLAECQASACLPCGLLRALPPCPQASPQAQECS
jgi:hypothetical protein